MKNSFYENKKFFKGKVKDKPKCYIPIKKCNEIPVFEPGDKVGFRRFFTGSEAIILYHRRNEKTGRIEYILKVDYSNMSEQVVYYSDIYLKPLTRKVLFEKSPKYTRVKSDAKEFIILSGVTEHHYFIS